ncbi:hypothetical protein [Afipia sp. P52-10]|jgi:hypothetical protein|uniref:hypothetical protein n=1 Tax=Afipia sp. P52-10 TaxID=1429916 RepID=UPI0006845D9D|nr:hypothetical protein [Afipia sp. P52-10]
MIQASTACHALHKRLVLALRYRGHRRLVEVHTVGITREQVEIMRAWQVAGGSVSGQPVGWKLIHLAEATEPEITDQPSQAPRPGYNPDDPAMVRIICRV